MERTGKRLMQYLFAKYPSDVVMLKSKLRAEAKVKSR